uniref:Uncharacterized protein n=1 Tax=Panagrolaimus sp. PS1159 TaxID=55785 RepID=A0AC35FTY5_9BILA
MGNQQSFERKLNNFRRFLKADTTNSFKTSQIIVAVIQNIYENSTSENWINEKRCKAFEDEIILRLWFANEGLWKCIIGTENNNCINLDSKVFVKFNVLSKKVSTEILLIQELKSDQFKPVCEEIPCKIHNHSILL